MGKFYLENVMNPTDNVIFFHSMEMPQVPAFAVGAPGAFKVDEWKEAMNEEVHRVAKMKASVREIVAAHKPAPEMHFHACDLYPPNVGENICKYAKENSTHVIIIGSRGQGMVRRTFLGSVSDYVSHHAHIPIVIVPPEPSHHN